MIEPNLTAELVMCGNGSNIKTIVDCFDVKMAVDAHRNNENTMWVEVATIGTRSTVFELTEAEVIALRDACNTFLQA